MFGCSNKKSQSNDSTNESSLDNTSSLNSSTTEAKEINILVFISGALDGNPPYENLNNGALAFAKKNPNVKIKTYEAGFNQAEWESQLTSLVATSKYDYVLTSNPSLPEICDRISKKFPNQKFIIPDAYFEGNKNIKTYEYNQYQQSVILGHLAGLITTSDMNNITKDQKNKKVGFIYAQEFPMMNEDIFPGFEAGLKQVDPSLSLDTRVIGNWYDASKASELALSMADSGVDTFTSIAGGAAQGLIKVAKDKGLYIVAYDTNSYNMAPGTIVGSGQVDLMALTQNSLQSAIDGTLDWGVASIIGVEDGYIGFYSDDPQFKKGLSENVYNQFMDWYSKVKNKTIIIKSGT
jgi:simple sugar transport system substrate-binding protein